MAQTLPPNGPDAAHGVRIDPEGNTPMAALARALAPTSDLTDPMFDELATEMAARLEKELAVVASGADDKESDRATDYTGEIAHRIVNARASSLAGFKAKAQAVFWAAGGDDLSWRDYKADGRTGTTDLFIFSIIDDLRALPSAAVHPFPHLAVVDPVETVSELKRTAAEFAACYAQADEIGARLDTAFWAAQAMYPEVPAAIRDPQRPGQWLDRDRLAQMDENARRLKWPKPEGSPRVEAFEKWAELRALIDGSFGVPGLEDSYEKARSAADAAADRIVGLRPATIQEALTKYAVLLTSYGDPNGEDIIAVEPFFGFVRDLEHLAKAG